MSTLTEAQPAAGAAETVDMTYREAITAALDDAMAADTAVLLMGEDVLRTGACMAALGAKVEQSTGPNDGPGGAPRWPDWNSTGSPKPRRWTTSWPLASATKVAGWPPPTSTSAGRRTRIRPCAAWS